MIGIFKFSNFLADHKDRQETCLKAATLIVYACSDVSGQGSEHPGTMQVQILLHGTSGTTIRRGTVESWLPVDGEIEEMKIEQIRPGERKQYRDTSHTTVQEFYATTVLQGDSAAAGAGKRLCVIHHGTGEVKKAGRLHQGQCSHAGAAASGAAAAPAILLLQLLPCLLLLLSTFVFRYPILG